MEKQESKQGEAVEINLQERTIGSLTDPSLPAVQIIQQQEEDAAQIHAPRYIP